MGKKKKKKKKKGKKKKKDGPFNLGLAKFDFFKLLQHPLFVVSGGLFLLEHNRKTISQKEGRRKGGRRNGKQTKQNKKTKNKPYLVYP